MTRVQAEQLMDLLELLVAHVIATGNDGKLPIDIFQSKLLRLGRQLGVAVTHPVSILESYRDGD